MNYPIFSEDSVTSDAYRVLRWGLKLSVSHARQSANSLRLVRLMKEMLTFRWLHVDVLTITKVSPDVGTTLSQLSFVLIDRPVKDV